MKKGKKKTNSGKAPIYGGPESSTHENTCKQTKHKQKKKNFIN